MGLHVFFGCYYNLFGIMKRIGALQNLRLKAHTHTFINTGGKVGELVSMQKSLFIHTNCISTRIYVLYLYARMTACMFVYM